MKQTIIFSILISINFSFLAKAQQSPVSLNAVEMTEGTYHPEMEADALLPKNHSEAHRWKIFEQAKFAEMNMTGPNLMPDWTNLGPNTMDTLSGRMLCLTIDPNDSNILYGGSGSGGVWKSENTGDTWFSLTDALPSMHVSAIAINPNNSNEILLGTGVGRVPTSTLASGVGVLKSIDGGQTWQSTSFQYSLSANESVYEILWDSAAPDKVYLAATNGLWVSTNNGDNWIQKKPERIYDLVLDKESPEILYAGVQNIGIQKTIDGGETWTTLTNGIANGSSVFRAGVALCLSQPNVLYAHLINSTNFGTTGVYKSENAGSSWTKLNNAPSAHCQPNNPNNCAGWLFNTIGVSPHDPDVVMVGGVQFWVSQNGGTSWTWMDYLSNGTGGGNPGLVYVDQWDIDFDLQAPGTVYVCNDGGVQVSTNNGTWWERQSQGLIIGQTYSIATAATNPDFMMGGFHDHGLQRLNNENDNTTWKRITTNDGIQTIINPANANILYGNIQNGVPYKSINGGLSAFPITNGITESGSWITPLLMDLENFNTLYTVSSAKIYKTTNGGSFWVGVANIPNVRSMTINQLNPNIIYAHSFNGNGWQLWRSLDKGDSWEQIGDASIPSFGTTALASSPHDINILYATRNSSIGATDHIHASYNGGENWIDITNDYPDIDVNDIMVSPLDANNIYLATALGVYVSTDAGESWCPFNNNLPVVNVMDVDFVEADSTIRIGTLGRGVWKTKAIAADISTNIEEVAATFSNFDINIFPNPASESVQIRLDLLEKANVRLRILDAKGQIVRTLFEGELLSHQQELEWDLKNSVGSKVSAGIYFVQMQFGKWGIFRKIVVHGKK